MKKIFTGVLAFTAAATAFAQWSPAVPTGESRRATGAKSFYSLDIGKIRAQLATAEPQGRNAKAVEVSIPTLEGRVERFRVYSFPVVAESLAKRYQLGSYVGVGMDDPKKYVRFSVAPNDFQAMIVKDGKYQFVEPQNADKSVYGVFAKTNFTKGSAFVCSTEESPASQKQMENLKAGGNVLGNDPTDFSKSSDRKYRTLRLVISTTGEYTQLFGSVEAALAQVNATLTRVNGVYEREMALHLNLQDYPQLIYTDPATDPYSSVAGGAPDSWTTELQKTLTNVVGEENYDIGHLFGHDGGGGNAGCIGCICESPTPNNPRRKGSAYTSPADKKPYGDSFDIDYVAHEIGHQLGANHTFSHRLESAGVNAEPGSGSTIMGYAGITSQNVQDHSDPYFHTLSIRQIQDNLIAKSCDVETPLDNQPPVVKAMADINIPKGTAFFLTAEASDAEGDPLLYSWEQVDNAKTATTSTNIGKLSSGPNFRVYNPDPSPVRYFPKFESVMNGVLDNSKRTWEAVSTVAREMNFAALVRENDPAKNIRQTQYATQKVVVGKDGPFLVTTKRVYNDIASAPIEWDVANTAAAPYNVQNVRIDYTEDNGKTWVVLADSTPNDGKENFDLRFLQEGKRIKVRISAIGNVFYAVKELEAKKFPTSAPNCVTLTGPANNADNVNYREVKLSWTAAQGGEMVDSYDVYLDTKENPTTLLASTAALSLSKKDLKPSTKYYWKVVPKNDFGANTTCEVYSFTTVEQQYCEASANNASYERISNVKFADIDNSSTSTAGYENFASVVANVAAGGTYTLTVTSAKSSIMDQVAVWIDTNNNKVFEENEMLLLTPKGKSPWTGEITIPSTMAKGTKTGMRIRLQDSSINSTFQPCGSHSYGQVEDYSIYIAQGLATGEADAGTVIKVYPNPAESQIALSGVPANARYSIFGMNGTLVSRGVLSAGKADVSALPKGTYLISVEDGDKKSTAKFIRK